MLRTLVKLPFKIALFPLKLLLQRFGLMREEIRPAPSSPPPRASTPRPAAPEPEVPKDLEVSGRDLVPRVAAAEPIVFVDVREARELASSGKIGGALHIPLRDLPRRHAEIEKESEVVLYCAAGMRSFDAAMFLREQGYGRAHSLVGGLPGWTGAGGAVEPA